MVNREDELDDICPVCEADCTCLPETNDTLSNDIDLSSDLPWIENERVDTDSPGYIEVDILDSPPSSTKFNYPLKPNKINNQHNKSKLRSQRNKNPNKHSTRPLTSGKELWVQNYMNWQQDEEEENSFIDMNSSPISSPPVKGLGVGGLYTPAHLLIDTDEENELVEIDEIRDKEEESSGYLDSSFLHCGDIDGELSDEDEEHLYCTTSASDSERDEEEEEGLPCISSSLGSVGYPIIQESEIEDRLRLRQLQEDFLIRKVMAGDNSFEEQLEDGFSEDSSSDEILLDFELEKNDSNNRSNKNNNDLMLDEEGLLAKSHPWFSSLNNNRPVYLSDLLDDPPKLGPTLSYETLENKNNDKLFSINNQTIPNDQSFHHQPIFKGNSVKDIQLANKLHLNNQTQLKYHQPLLLPNSRNFKPLSTVLSNTPKNSSFKPLVNNNNDPSSFIRSLPVSTNVSQPPSPTTKSDKGDNDKQLRLEDLVDLDLLTKSPNFNPNQNSNMVSNSLESRSAAALARWDRYPVTAFRRHLNGNHNINDNHNLFIINNRLNNMTLPIPPPIEEVCESNKDSKKAFLTRSDSISEITEKVKNLAIRDELDLEDLGFNLDLELNLSGLNFNTTLSNSKETSLNNHNKMGLNEFQPPVTPNPSKVNSPILEDSLINRESSPSPPPIIPPSVTPLHSTSTIKSNTIHTNFTATRVEYSLTNTQFRNSTTRLRTKVYNQAILAKSKTKPFAIQLLKQSNLMTESKAVFGNLKLGYNYKKRGFKLNLNNKNQRTLIKGHRNKTHSNQKLKRRLGNFYNFGNHCRSRG